MAIPKPKQVNLKWSDLTPNPENIRFTGGSNILGVNVRDTRNVSTMKMVLKEKHGYPDRLRIEKRLDKDGKVKNIILCGNRRWFAADELIKDPTTSQELAKELQTVPCDVYEDITDEQRNELVNDQRSQKFLRSEMTAYIFRLQRGGWGFSEIAMHVYPQMGGYTAAGAQKLAAVERCQSDADKKKMILSWLKGTLDMTTLACGKLGPRVQKALLLSDMQTDGILPIIGKDAEGNDKFELPEFKPSQGRCNDLIKAKNESPDWTPENGSASFNALIEKYAAEDRGERVRDVVRPNISQLKEQMTRTRSRAARVALEYASGEKVLHYADVDDESNRLEQITALMLKYRDGLKEGGVKDAVQAFLKSDPHEFERFLIVNS